MCEVVEEEEEEEDDDDDDDDDEWRPSLQVDTQMIKLIKSIFSLFSRTNTLLFIMGSLANISLLEKHPGGKNVPLTWTTISIGIEHYYLTRY